MSRIRTSAIGEVAADFFPPTRICPPTPGADAADWFGRKFGQEPGYSDLLTDSKSAEVRAQLLHPFFEPSPEERAHGLKVRTAAQIAIADLVESGHLKLIPTTNFDRLIETTIEERGIAPTVNQQSGGGGRRTATGSRPGHSG